MLSLHDLEERAAAHGGRQHAGSARAAFAARLNSLKPQASMSTAEYARTKRKLRNSVNEIIDFDPSITPYTIGMMDAADHPLVRTVLGKGNARSGKTVFAECKLLKHWSYGPFYNVMWLMQDDDAVVRYIDERGEDMLRIHEEVNERVDWSNRRQGRKSKKIGGSNALWSAATLKLLRGTSAPIIVADEIDGYNKRVRDGITTLVRNRQREFGSTSLAMLMSHPDAGPHGGIDLLLKDSLLHLWWMICMDCGEAASPAAEAATRFRWNVPQLMAHAQTMPRLAFLDFVAENARLVCPHCKAEFDDAERLAMSNAGVWLQPHQSIVDGEIIGAEQVQATMGFVIHALMSPFVKLPEIARDWAAAKLTADTTGNDVALREETVKSLGETYEATIEEEKVEDADIVMRRLQTAYELRTVPAGVDFLTAFVDQQGDRFPVRVIGWSRAGESWMIDAFEIKQPRGGAGGRPAYENLDPANRLADWDVLEDLLDLSYPLADNPSRIKRGDPELFMPLAKIVVDENGPPGGTTNARTWYANLMARGKAGAGPVVEEYRVSLVFGSARENIPYVGPAKQREVDEHNRALPTPVYSHEINVFQIKRLIARRMKIGEPGPGAMHLPFRMKGRYVRELVSERLTNGVWVKIQARNETWDGWVMCEAARLMLKPNREGLWDGVLPAWAAPRERDGAIAGAIRTASVPSVIEQLADFNARE